MSNQDAFFALLRAGLWEKDVQLLPFETIDYSVIYRLAEEQAVIGLIAAGLVHVIDTKVPKKDALIFVGNALQQEQRNSAMNSFVGTLVEKMRDNDIYTILVKGQGIAQCYERPLWRSSGDVDLLLSNTNYCKAKDYLIPLASSFEEEYEYNKHVALTIDSWTVELHGNLLGDLWRSIDRTIEEVQDDVFSGNIRSWLNGKTQIFLPGVNEDVFFAFTHILQHYFKEGIGLRQICDWCRLLWTYRDSVDEKKLVNKLKQARVVSEWKVFASLAVDWLGMPAEYIPLYSESKIIRIKAERVVENIMETGNFGHNRDLSYKRVTSQFERKIKVFGRITGDTFRHFPIFPKDSIKVWISEMLSGLSALKDKPLN